jgi:hypothetical protein
MPESHYLDSGNPAGTAGGGWVPRPDERRPTMSLFPDEVESLEALEERFSRRLQRW